MELTGLFNYWVVIVLMMLGFYVVITRHNLIKKMVGLNIFQVSVFLFYISMSKVRGGTAPILDDGIDVSEFTQRFGEPPAGAYAETIAELESLGLLTAGGDALRLTHRGRMLGNEVFSRFF